MCGICGLVERPGKMIEHEIIKKMSDEITHRGPDDSGVFVSGNTALGHRRLSIIDLNTGQQPIYNEDKSAVIVFNGEIYNFNSLKRQLEEKGHIFKTKTDTETIIHLYEEYSYKCLDYLRGMFAFAIYDKKNDEIFIARDRLGQKPLYYALQDGRFYFASEIKSIISDSRFKVEVNNEAIHYYLSYKYVPHPHTAFKDIYKLPHAHYLVYRNSKISINKYWKNWYSIRKTADDIQEIKNNINNLLLESVKLRLISDVPLGAFLSGGIDSSIIVALMCRNSNSKVKTFSIGFKDKKWDETYYSDMVAEKYKTEHHKFIVEPDCIKDIPKLVWHYNEPFSDPSMMPTYYLCRETRKHVTVALSGDAGDENFAGYLRYLAFKLISYIDFIPVHTRKFLIDKLKFILPKPYESKSMYNKFYHILNIVAKDGLSRYMPMVEDFSDEYKKRIYTGSFYNEIKNVNSADFLNNYFVDIELEDMVDRLLYLDINTYLPDDLMVKVDIAGMANSLECRAPFMDHKFMEYVSSIPSGLKLKGNKTKYILKESFKELLPEQLVNRNKMGFGVPISRWFRSDLKTFVKSLLNERFHNRNIFKKDRIEEILDSHISGKSEHAYQLWTLMCLELWHRMFIDKDFTI